LNKTIANIFAFVILIASICLASSGCTAGFSDKRAALSDSDYLPPRVVGRISSRDISESSGLAASKCNPKVFWTHNDSGDRALIYALDISGESLGTWELDQAKNIDWEDIAASKNTEGKCFLYIGEIGDNQLKRSVHEVYRVAEPTVRSSSGAAGQKDPSVTGPIELLRFRYPDGDHNAESLMVHPGSGQIYIVTKQVSGPAGVYRVTPDFASSDIQVAKKVGDVSVPSVPNGLLTGGDISPDGSKVILCDYMNGYEYRLPENAIDFEVIWDQKPFIVDIGKRDGGEAVCYGAEGSSIFSTSEGKKPPLFQIESRR
jgi:hypothetical protein